MRTEVSKVQPLVDEVVRLLNLHRDTKIVGEKPGRDGKILSGGDSDQRQDGNVAMGGIGNLARWGPSAVNEAQKQNKTAHKYHIGEKPTIILYTVHLHLSPCRYTKNERFCRLFLFRLLL